MLKSKADAKNIQLLELLAQLRIANRKAIAGRVRKPTGRLGQSALTLTPTLSFLP